MKAITFLGTTQYKLTTYVYRGQEYETELFAETLPHFFPDLERVLVFVTPTVQQHPNLAALGERLGERLQPVPIPRGRSEEELWAIFDALTGAVDEGETVLFDITNSFRSIPLLVFLAAAYLRTARQVRLRGVIYGAFEARDATNRSPVFDLTPFVGLLDWLTATNQFIYTGDARYLAHLLEKEGQSRRSNALRQAGESLRDLSLAMMLCRPLEVMGRAGGLGRALARAQAALAQGARPFGLLAGRVEREYAARALPEPTAGQNVEASLRHQLDLIRWYLDNNQVIQAMTLAREWVVTAVGWRLGRGFVLSPPARKALERGLNGLIRVGREGKDGTVFTGADLNDEGQILWNWPEREALRDLWAHLPNVRNELNHAGMRTSRMKAAKIARQAGQEIRPRLEALAQSWKLLE